MLCLHACVLLIIVHKKKRILQKIVFFILIDGVTYVRWGRKGCPDGADIVYTGDQSYFNGL